MRKNLKNAKKNWKFTTCKICEKHNTSKQKVHTENGKPAKRKHAKHVKSDPINAKSFENKKYKQRMTKKFNSPKCPESRNAEKAKTVKTILFHRASDFYWSRI